MVFCHTLVGSVLCRLISEMYDYGHGDEHQNFKKQLCKCVTCASPQPRIKKKNP